MTFVLRAHNIWKSVGGKPVLAGISLRVKRSSIYFVVAPRGSGKTLLARILSGDEAPDKGFVYVNDIPITYSEAKSLVSRYPPRIPMTHTVLDAFMTTARRAGIHPRDAKERTIRLSNYFGLGEHMDRYLDALPRNILVRVLVAVTVFKKPLVAVLDDPFRDIDASEALFLMDRVRLLARSEGTAFIITTSNPVIADMGDYVYIMYGGRIVEEGWREDLINRVLGEGMKAEIVAEDGELGRLGAKTLSVKRLGDRVIAKILLRDIAELPRVIEELIESGARPLFIKIDQLRVNDVYDAIVSGLRDRG